MGRRWNGRKGVVLILGAFLYALLYALCSQIDETGVCERGTTLIRFACAFPIALAALYVLFRFVLPRLACAPEGNGRRFCTIGAFIGIFCCYVPMFLAFYPGSFTYDSIKQTWMIAQGEYSTLLPLLHTLLLRFCLSWLDLFQSMEACGALYSVIQMLLLAGLFALVCASLSRSVSRKAAWLAAIFYGLYPAHMAFASNCTKDGLFGGFLALFLALCFEDARLGALPRRRRVAQIAAGALACMLRSNLILAAVLWALLLIARGRCHLRLALYGALIVALSLGGNAALKALTHASGGSAGELMSVPAQQLVRARLYAPESFTQEQAELMDSAFIVKGQMDMETFYHWYEPTLADLIKDRIDVEFTMANLPELARLWVSVGMRCPGVYLDAFLNLALPTLYPYRTYRVVSKYIEVGSESALTRPYGLPELVPPARFEGVRNWLMERIFDTGADDQPVLRWLFNTGLIYWLVLMYALYELYSGQRGRAAVMLLPVLLWFLYLFGPVMQGRYLYPFVCALPLFAARPKGQEIFAASGMNKEGGNTDGI